MSELIEACLSTCKDLQRHQVLVHLAGKREREGWSPPEDADLSETGILLEVYLDRSSAMLERLQEDLREVLELYETAHRNP